MLLFLISLQSAILRVSYEQHCTLVTQSECTYFYVLAISENSSGFFCSAEKSVTKKVLQRYYKLLISTFRAGGNISISPFRSSQRKHSIKKVILKILQNSQDATLSKKRFRHRCFPVNFSKFLKALILQYISGRLLLSVFENWLEKKKKINFLLPMIPVCRVPLRYIFDGKKRIISCLPGILPSTFTM